MGRKIFVTGSNGFVGRRLTKFLETSGFEVFPYSQKLENNLVLRDSIYSFLPDIVVHLAGLSNIPYCEQHPDEAYISNVAGTSLLLEQMIRLPKIPRLIFTSSVQVYDLHSPKASEGPIDENFVLCPNNVYGRTKHQAELIVRGVVDTYGLNAVVLRLFNHTHKEHGAEFFLPSMYNQIKDAPNGGSILVGNLELYRDFSLLSDLLVTILSVVQKLEEKDGFEVFNVCSGQARRLRDLVLGIAGVLGKSISLQEDSARHRVSDPYSIVGSANKLRIQTGCSQPIRTNDEYIKLFLS